MSKVAQESAGLKWLVVGAVAGLAAAGVGILRQADSGVPLPDSAIARVNDRVIGREVYERTLARAADNEVSDDDRARLLERLVDDELLVQRALELGMAQSDTTVRNAIINSLVASITAEADAANPTDEELEQYLAANPDRFSFVESLWVSAWQSDDEAIAQAFVADLRNTGQPVPREGIDAIPDLPAGFLTLELLRDYLGPGIAAAASEMPPGSSAVFARRGRWLVVHVEDQRSAVLTDLGKIRSRVLQDYRRNLARQALEDYIGELRQRAVIETAAP